MVPSTITFHEKSYFPFEKRRPGDGAPHRRSRSLQNRIPGTGFYNTGSFDRVSAGERRGRGDDDFKADGGGGAWRKVDSKEDSGVGRGRNATVRDFAAEGQLSDQFE